jgi:hypothetical protein
MSNGFGVTYRSSGYLTRSLSEDGAVFFDTTNRLLPGDVNGKTDVYEYDAAGLHLISTGTSPDPVSFRDASASGDDVFFITTQALAGGDGDRAMSLYDARVGGGFAQPQLPPTCEGIEGEGSCRGPLPTPPDAASPLSAMFVGPGNPPPPPPPRKLHCKKGFRQVKVHGRRVCKRVRKHHKHRRPTAGARPGAHR